MDVLLSHLQNRDIIVPYFGVHPWFSHLFYLDSAEKPDKRAHYNRVLKPTPSEDLLAVLPEPMSLSQHSRRSEEIIAKYKLARFGVGEIGLDKLFRVPNAGFLGNPAYGKAADIANDEVDKLSKSRVSIQHQMDVFRYQLKLAERLNRQVSVHCVKAHGVLYDEMMKFPSLTVLLHSYTGSIDQARRWIKSKKQQALFFSFSNWINGEKLQLLELLATELDRGQILTESDIYIDRLFTHDKHAEYFNHLVGIYAKLNNYIDLDASQIESNMLASINASS
ncbi:uncharacterized protein LODBEIA_P32550 [Lodderomyces beijingensis]|uniref:Uncharacterized protein n=1 Tax=Lodderomyces beijingensis TaxID=1775926 RepID=A0ABP0ZQ28_9ASCO